MATAYWEDDTRTAAGSGFWQAGHRPTLIAAFLYFDLAFMVWVLLGPLAPEIAATLHLSAACLLYTSPSPRDRQKSRMPSSA